MSYETILPLSRPVVRPPLIGVAGLAFMPKVRVGVDGFGLSPHRNSNFNDVRFSLDCGDETPKIGRKKPKAVELLLGDCLIFKT